jgi:transposase
MTALTAYEAIIVKWLEAYPGMTSAQVRDWLEERHRLDAADRTVRRYVSKLREQYGILKDSEPRREYEAVEELPKGYQLQLDFDERTVRNAYGSGYVRLYFVVFTLSYSRYKWSLFLDRPFMSADLVEALYGCFNYFGGTPRQLVYDQDSIIVVSENSGDIIHTQAFSAFLAESKLELRVCRKSDPETKGKIEASVKYVKGSFMENRHYMGIDVWNRSFEDWLTRAAKRRHGTTKRKPVEEFEEEREYLLPIYGVAPAGITEEMERNVRRDNTIWYRSNRYSVPSGTYTAEKKVFLAVKEGRLEIMNRTGDSLATHEISSDKGRLIRPNSHRRDKSERIKAQLEKAVLLLGEEFREYLEDLCLKKPRYVKEQLSIVLGACEAHGRERVLTAMHYCKERELYSANDLRDATAAMNAQTAAQPCSGRLPVEDERYHIPVQKRALSVYAKIAGESGVAQ